MENNDNEVMHQGKSITQWEKDFKGEFTYDQLLKMAKGGCDLQKILVLGLDEGEKCDEGCQVLPLDTDEGLNEVDSDVEDAALSESKLSRYVVKANVDGTTKGFSVNAKDEADAEAQVKATIKKHSNGSNPKVEIASIAKENLDESIKPNYIVHVKVLGINTAFSVNAKDEADAEKQVRDQVKKLANGSNPKVEIEKVEAMRELNESFGDEVVTVKDFKKAIDKSLSQVDDDIIFRIAKGKEACMVFDIHSKGGTTVIDLMQIPKGESMTVGEFVVQLNRAVHDTNDKIMFRTIKDKAAYSVVEVYNNGDTTVVDLAPSIANSTMNETAPWEDSSGITDDQWAEAAKWFEANGFEIHDSDEGGFTFTKPVDGKQFYTGQEGYELYLNMKDA